MYRKFLLMIAGILLCGLVFQGVIFAQEEATASSTILEHATPTPSPRPDLTQKTEESVEPLKALLDDILK